VDFIINQKAAINTDIVEILSEEKPSDTQRNRRNFDFI
jgi:hypothetical protein